MRLIVLLIRVSFEDKYPGLALWPYLRWSSPAYTGLALACKWCYCHCSSDRSERANNRHHNYCRWEAMLFLSYYLACTLYLILASTQHRTLPLFSMVMVVFVMPITLLTPSIITWQAIRAKHSPATGNGSEVRCLS